MASTITEVANLGGVGGARTVKIVTGNLGTYAANGIAITPGQCKLSRIDAIIPSSAGGIIFEWVQSTLKMKAYQDVTPAAAAPLGEVGSTDITTTVFTAIVIGVP